MAEKIVWWLGRPWNWQRISVGALLCGLFVPPFAPFAILFLFAAGLSLYVTGGTLPIRLPMSSRVTDRSETFTDDDNKPVFSKAGGIFYIGTVRSVDGVRDEHVGEQVYVTNSIARTHFAYVGTTGSGKPQPLDSLVLTVGGWKRMGDMRPGDEVCTPDGGTAPVLQIFDQGMQDVFEIEFEDGRTVLASDDHVWKVGEDGGEEQVATIDLFNYVQGLHRPVFVPLPQPWRDAPDVVMPEGEADSPYVMARDACSIDRDDAMLDAALTRGSTHQRALAIRGVMDRLAVVRESDVLVTHRSERLCRQIAYLVHSVGGKARVERDAGASLWTIAVRHPDARGMFTRHDLREQAASLPECLPWVRISSVRYVGRTECRCIYVDHPDHLYVTDGFIVTHNTEAILSYCVNPLAWGSGFILTDGKAEVITPNKVYAIARRLLREDDFRVLNFMNAGRDIWEVQKNEGRYSNTFNPPQRSSSGQLTQLMSSLMAEAGSDPMWKGLAIGMIDAVNRALKYKQFRGLIEVDFGVIRDSIDLEAVIDLCAEFDPTKRNFPELDEALIFKPLKAYLLNLPGFDWNKIMKAPKGKREIPEDLNKQHNFRSMQFMRQLTMLCDTYGPAIFKHKYPEVDMEDVVRMRRILVVLLPSLGMSDEESEAVGKLVITALRMMMAKTLGDKIEGTYAELNESRPTASPAPFFVVMDEIGYYFAQGISVMYAQARSLGFAMMAAGQTLAPIYKDKIKHEAKGMLANAGCTFSGLMKDPDETAEYFMKLAGESMVAETTGFEGSAMGGSVAYLDRMQGSLQQRKRVDYAELSSMKEGENILVFKNRVIRVKNFYVFGKAKIPKSAPMLLNKLVPIVSPKIGELERLVIRYSDASKVDDKLAGAIYRAIATLNRGGSLEDLAPPPVSTPASDALMAIADRYANGLSDLNRDSSSRIIGLLKEVERITVGEDSAVNNGHEDSSSSASSGSSGSVKFGIKQPPAESEQRPADIRITDVLGTGEEGDAPKPAVPKASATDLLRSAAMPEIDMADPLASLMSDLTGDQEKAEAVVQAPATPPVEAAPVSVESDTTAALPLNGEAFDQDGSEAQLDADSVVISPHGSAESSDGADEADVLGDAFGDAVAQALGQANVTVAAPVPERVRQFIAEGAAVLQPESHEAREQAEDHAYEQIKSAMNYAVSPEEVPVVTEPDSAQVLEDELKRALGMI